MKKTHRLLCWLALSMTASCLLAGDPLAHTYSIVARDATTGEIGVAVQSHWFQVGPIVPWATAGVGAVATQSFVKVDYGPRGLELMADGLSAQDALDTLLAADPQRDVRQVAMIDGHGRVATWTGPRCIRAAGHQTGDGYSVQANLMTDESIWPAMAEAFESSSGDLAARLLAALEAAEAAGGDIRGRQSAALIVVRGESTGEPWSDRLVDLRVDDHEAPLAELRRLLDRHRAYEEMNRGDEAMAEEDVPRALRHYTRAAKVAPDIVEIPFWQAVTLFGAGQEAEALEIFAQVFAREQRWVEVARRLPEAGLLPAEPAKLEAILARAPAKAPQDPVSPSPAAAAPGPGPPGADGPPGWLRIEGRITNEGVECLALRADDGELYTLIGEVDSLAIGQEVWVEGQIAEMSTCMQGMTLVIGRSGDL